MSGPNPYCERLGIAMPRVERLVGHREAGLFRLLVAALLEQGRPMPLEEIADRLAAAGVSAPSGDLLLSLKKAWHGRDTVHRDPDGRLALNLDARELDFILLVLGLREPRFRSPSVTPEPEPELPGDDVPLTAEEVALAFRDASLSAISPLRQAAAVLDTRSGPMAPGEIEEILAGLTRYRARIDPETIHWWRTSKLVRVDDGGRLAIDRTAPDLAAMRRAVRKLERAAILRQRRKEDWRRAETERKGWRAEEDRRQAAVAASLRRAVLRAVPDAAHPEAIAIVDVAKREVASLAGAGLAAAPHLLSRYDVLAGLHVRDTIHALGLDPVRFRLADLKPPQKTWRLNRRGRTLAITPERLISSTTGISRPFGDPARVAEYLGRGDHAKVARRIESDAKALHAFYRYGALHGCVRLRWGFLDEVLGVDWTLPGEPLLYESLKRAAEGGTEVELVVGAAPGWSDPWARARRARIVSIEPWTVTVSFSGDAWRTRIDQRDIQAVRPASPPS